MQTRLRIPTGADNTETVVHMVSGCILAFQSSTFFEASFILRSRVTRPQGLVPSSESVPSLGSNSSKSPIGVARSEASESVKGVGPTAQEKYETTGRH